MDALIGDIAAQLGDTKPILIVIDTLNRSLAGSESRDEDMSAYIQACDRIRLYFNCAVLVVHHCGMEKSRPRGHTSLTGAADAQIAVKRDKAIIVATVEYMKDGPEGDEIASRLVIVDDIGTDDDGQPIVSCIIEPSDARTQKPRRSPTGQNGTAFQLLRKALADHGQDPPNSRDFPTARQVVPLTLWRSYCQKGGLAEGDKDEAFKKAWNRVRNSLRTGGYIGIWDRFVWIVEPEGDKGT